MVSLNLREPRWIESEGEDHLDQCAHGRVDLAVNGLQLLSSSDGEWTVSAAALFLMRSVTSNHDAKNSVSEGNFLIPCCGFSVYPTPDAAYPCVVIGCSNGVDLVVNHENGQVNLTRDDESVSVSPREWAMAVLGFADQVRTFYLSSGSKSKISDDEDRMGWEAFWEEWGTLHRELQDIASAA